MQQIGNWRRLIEQIEMPAMCTHILEMLILFSKKQICTVFFGVGRPQLVQIRMCIAKNEIIWVILALSCNSNALKKLSEH